MNYNPGLVSVIVPCYEQAQYLPESLDSVLAQTYSNWECIIVNDGSPDNAEDIAKSYCNKDERFKYIRQSNKGVSAARDAGIRYSSGEYLLPLDADDKIGARYLELAITHFSANPATKLVHCKADFFGEYTGPCDLPDYNYSKMLFGGMILCSSVFRRSDWDQTGGYDETMMLGYEDWEFLIRFLDESAIIYQTPETCFYYRTIEGSRSKHITDEIRKQLFRQIVFKHSKKYEQFLPDIIELNFQVSQQAAKIIELTDENMRISAELVKARKSKAYRIGKLILAPLKFILSFFSPMNRKLQVYF